MPNATPQRAPERTPAPVAHEPARPGMSFDGPLDLTLVTIVSPDEPDAPAASTATAAPPSFASSMTSRPQPARPIDTMVERFDHLHGMMNDIIRDFLAPHRRFFFQLKIERAKTTDELLELLHDLQAALAKARGEAFASEVIARLRNAAL